MRLRELAGVFAKVGLIGFGGGVGMLALIRQQVVEKRRWIDDRQLAVAVAMGQMLPGPFVSNYAEYIGYELRGIAGLLVAVTALLLPSFLLMLGLSITYFSVGTLPVVQKIFSGLQPVVAGILVWATWRIGRANITSVRAALVGLVAAVALFLKVDALLVLLGCGLLGALLFGQLRDIAGRGTGALATVGLWLGGATVQTALPRAAELSFVFLKVGTLIFGGGFAAIPFLQQELVVTRGWLSAREFIDCVALGQLTPGPVAIMGVFIGYKVLGLPGTILAALGTFLPSTLMLIGLIRVYQRVRESPLVKGFLSGVMPAIAGMMLPAALAVGKVSITGILPAVMMALTVVLLLRFRADPVWLVIGGAVIGLIKP